MLNTFFNTAVCKIFDLLPFQGPNFSFFLLSFSPAHRRTHTETDSLVSVKQFQLMPLPCRSEEPSTAQMTQSQATQLPSFLCLEQKKNLWQELTSGLSYIFGCYTNGAYWKEFILQKATGYLKGFGTGAKGEMWWNVFCSRLLWKKKES